MTPDLILALVLGGSNVALLVGIFQRLGGLGEFKTTTERRLLKLEDVKT